MAVKRNVGNLIDETYIFGQKVPKQYGTTKAKFSVEKYQPSHYVDPLQTDKCINCLAPRKQSFQLRRIS